MSVVGCARTTMNPEGARGVSSDADNSGRVNSVLVACCVHDGRWACWKQSSLTRSIPGVSRWWSNSRIFVGSGLARWERDRPWKQGRAILALRVLPEATAWSQ